MNKSLIAFTLFTLLNIPATNAVEAKKTMIPVTDLKSQAWLEASSVGPEHKVLNKAVGTWSYKSKWWESENLSPKESTGKTKMKLILGGRYLQQEATGKAEGKKFEGLGFIGYDNLQEGYDVIWMDNMGTGITRSTASYDENTKELSEVGKFTDPMATEKVSTYQAKWKFIDKNNMTYTMYVDHHGKPMKQMEIIYKRVI